MEKLIKCYNCGGSFGIAEVRYAPDGKLMCRACLERRFPSSGIKAGEEEAQETVAYVCSRCHYMFTRKANVVVKVCPYCGRESVQKQKSTSTLIKESDEEEYEL